MVFTENRSILNLLIRVRDVVSGSKFLASKWLKRLSLLWDVLDVHPSWSMLTKLSRNPCLFFNVSACTKLNVRVGNRSCQAKMAD